MGRLPFGAYSRDRMVEAITSFYSFLRTMHSETAGLGRFQYPPSTGWSHITPDLFPYYTEEVVDLIRHLPYYNDERFFVLPDTNLAVDADPGHLQMCARFNEREEEKRARDKEAGTEAPGSQPTKSDDENTFDDGDEPDYPPYIFTLAQGGQYGSSVLVDTKHNAIIRWEYGDGCRDMPRDITSKYDVDCFLSYSKDEDSDGDGDNRTEDNDHESGDDDDDSCESLNYRRGDEWKTSPAYAPEDFFEMCKEQFRIMNWMPVLYDLGCGQIIELYRHQEFTGENLKIMKILRNAGWPGDGEGGGWDKASAEAAMNRMEEESHEERCAVERGIRNDISMEKKLKNLVVREGK